MVQVKWAQHNLVHEEGCWMKSVVVVTFRISGMSELQYPTTSPDDFLPKKKKECVVHAWQSIHKLHISMLSLHWKTVTHIRKSQLSEKHFMTVSKRGKNQKLTLPKSFCICFACAHSLSVQQSNSVSPSNSAYQSTDHWTVHCQFSELKEQSVTQCATVELCECTFWIPQWNFQQKCCWHNDWCQRLCPCWTIWHSAVGLESRRHCKSEDGWHWALVHCKWGHTNADDAKGDDVRQEHKNSCCCHHFLQKTGQIQFCECCCAGGCWSTVCLFDSKDMEKSMPFAFSCMSPQITLNTLMSWELLLQRIARWL